MTITAATLAYRSIPVADPVTGRDITLFYREAGPRTAPAVLLLHGFAASSHMFRSLIPLLADKYRVIAPDLPGFGFSDAPDARSFDYSFDHLAKIIDSFTGAVDLQRYALYVFDYGAPVGFRLAMARPDRISALITQNGNAYEEGLSEGWNPIQAYWRDPSVDNRAALRGFLTSETTKFQYLHGVEDATRVAPEAYTLDQYFLDRPGNDEIQLDLFRDYQSNLALYPQFQAYFRAHQPPTLAVWGKNDPFFLPVGAEAYKRDLPEAEIRFVESGHFPLETHVAEIAGHIRPFLARALDRQQGLALFGEIGTAGLSDQAAAPLAQAEAMFGFVPNLARAMAREPSALTAYLHVLRGLGESALSPIEQQLVMATASHVNEAVYGVAVHTTLSVVSGGAPDYVAAVRDGAPLKDPKLEALRQFTAALATGRAQVSDAHVAAFVEAGYDARAAVAVALGVASKTFANAVAHLARPEIDAPLRAAIGPR